MLKVCENQNNFAKNHQNFEWGIQDIINHINFSAGPSRCKFLDNLWIN